MFPQLTILCPVFNEERVIPLFFARIMPVIEALRPRYRVDLVFLNNASTDASYEVIEGLRRDHSFIYVISMSANVGYQRSLECGLRNAKGDIIAFIDVDCEDPPEMLLQFIERYEQGYDIVYGERVDREEVAFVKMLRNLFYQVANRFADEDIILYMAEFSLITAEVRDAMVADCNSFPFIRNSIARVGFRRIGIPYKRHKRIAGETHYNLIGMTVFGVAGILSSSTLPLRLPIYLLPIWLLLTTLLGAAQLNTGNAWFMLANVVLAAAYLGSAVAFIAIYVARAYKNGLQRPNYVIHRRLTHKQPEHITS